MSDIKNFIPSKDQYDIAKDVLGCTAETIGLFFPKVPEKIAAKRIENLISVFKIAKKKFDEAGLKPEERKAISLKLGLPIIEKASLEEDSSLQELWANLLANALNPDRSEKVRNIFVDIIQNLSALDVLILNAFHMSDHPLVPHPKNIIQVYTQEGYKPYPSKTVETSLHVLMGLNLATDMAPTNQLQLGSFNAVQTTEVHLTPLGILFIDACVKDASK